MKLKKAELLAKWKNLPEANPAKSMRPLPYKHEGSTYGNDGIRIDGSPEFIFAVLSRLKDLLILENSVTRLQASFNEIAERTKVGDGVEFGAGTGSYCCYVRAAMRGEEGSMAEGFFNKESAAKSREYLALLNEGKELKAA